MTETVKTALPSDGEIIRTMQVMLGGIADIAENHGFARGDDLMVWLAKNLPPVSRTQSPAEWQVEAGLNQLLNAKTLTPRERVRAILRAASITPPAPERSKEEVGVTVKPLEWHKSHMPSWNDDWHTTTPFIYSIRCADENGWKWSAHGGCGYASTPDAAKAAAQADYEQRIRSALEPASLHKADPTEEMIAAGLGVDFDNEDERAVVINVWHAMYATSPQPVTPSPKEVTDYKAEAADILKMYNDEVEAYAKLEDSLIRLSDQDRQLLRMIIPSVDQRSREPMDAWNQAAAVLWLLVDTTDPIAAFGPKMEARHAEQ